jgi:hypothetical protein
MASKFQPVKVEKKVLLEIEVLKKTLNYLPK